MKKKLQKLLIIIALFIITFLICMGSNSNIFSKNLISQIDSNVFRYIGWSMTEGYVPYVDLFDHKGLLLYFINYLGALISPMQGIWIIEMVFMFVSVAFAYKLARKFTNKSVSLFITLIAFSLMSAYFEGGNFTEEYALPFQLIALNIFFDFFLNPKKYSSTEIVKDKNLPFRLNFKWFNVQVFICGICFAAVLFLRANMISVWIAFCIMVLIYCVEKKKYKELIKFIISFICGILLFTIPMLIYLVINGALGSFIDQYILFNMKYSSKLANTLLETTIFFLDKPVTVIAFIIIIMKVYQGYRKNENWYFDLGYLFYMIVTLFLVVMGGRLFRHYAMTFIPMLIYPYCVLYKFLDKKEVKSAGVNLVVTAYLLITIVIPFGVSEVEEFGKYISGEKGSATMTQEIYEVVDYISKNTEKDDLISTFGNIDYIYLLTQRQSASKYSYQLPILAMDQEMMDEYLADLIKNKAKIVVLQDPESEHPMVKIMKEFLKENYTSELENKELKVYKIK